MFVVMATTLERTARTTITHASYLSLCEANNGLSLPPNINNKNELGQSNHIESEIHQENAGHMNYPVTQLELSSGVGSYDIPWSVLHTILIISFHLWCMPQQLCWDLNAE